MITDSEPMPRRTCSAAAPTSRNSIGFIRLTLAMLVIYSHSYLLSGLSAEPGSGDLLRQWSRQSIGAGTMAVQAFFVLSGALIATSWNRSGSLLAYLWHRLLRLGPALWACLVVTAFVLAPLIWLAESGPRATFLGLDPSPSDYVLRNLLQPRSQPTIGALPDRTPWPHDLNGALWTLYYEGACYLLVAVLGAAGLLRRWRATGGLLLLGAVIAFVIWAAWQPSWLPPLANRLFDTPGKQLTYFFLAGVLWASFPEVTRLCLRPVVFVAAAITLILAWRAGLGSSAGPLLMPVVLFWLAEALPFADFERTVGGDYSYGLYVYGYPVQQVLAQWGLHQYGLTLFCVAGIAGAALLAMLSWHFIEAPALSLKRCGAQFPRLTWAP